MILTIDELENLEDRPCQEQLDILWELWPEGDIPLSEEAFQMAMAREVNVEWAECLLDQEARNSWKDYWRALSDQYSEAIKPYRKVLTEKLDEAEKHANESGNSQKIGELYKEYSTSTEDIEKDFALRYHRGVFVRLVETFTRREAQELKNEGLGSG